MKNDYAESISLNLKNMKKIYFQSNADEDVWNTFYKMCSMGFISMEVWNKFFEACKDWVWDEDKNAVIEMFTEKVVRI